MGNVSDTENRGEKSTITGNHIINLEGTEREIKSILTLDYDYNEEEAKYAWTVLGAQYNNESPEYITSIWTSEKNYKAAIPFKSLLVSCSVSEIFISSLKLGIELFIRSTTGDVITQNDIPLEIYRLILSFANCVTRIKAEDACAFLRAAVWKSRRGNWWSRFTPEEILDGSSNDMICDFLDRCVGVGSSVYEDDSLSPVEGRGNADYYSQDRKIQWVCLAREQHGNDCRFKKKRTLLAEIKDSLDRMSEDKVLHRIGDTYDFTV